MTHSEHVDPQALDRLREWGGDKLVGQMLRLFLENSLARMDQIRAGVAQRDLSEAEKGAHSLKSSAANVGAGKVREVSAVIERLCTDGDMEGFLVQVPLLEEAYANARIALEAAAKEIPE